MKLSKRLNIPSSATGRIYDLAIQKRKAGITVYNFSAGDLFFPIHPVIEKGVQEALVKGDHIVSYPPLAGVAELRLQIAQWMQRRYSSPYSSEEVVVTNGGKFALFAILQALLNAGDEVLVPAPYWVSYLPIIQFSEAHPLIVPTFEEKGWKVTPDDLQKQATPKTKLLILNNGCNPTGILYSFEEIENILKWAQKNNIFVLSDEVYSEMVYDGKTYISCASFPHLQENMAIVQSFSKNFGMSGWRVGFALGPKQLIDAVIRLQGQSTTGTSIVSQWAALAAIQNADAVTAYVRQEMDKRRDLFISTFNSLFQAALKPPASAMYQFVAMEELGVSSRDSLHFCEQAMDRASVAMVPGVACGQEGYIRFAFSEKASQIVKGLESLSRFCKGLS